MAVSVRMDPLMEKELELAAKRKGVTKSQFIIEAVERALGRKNPYELFLKVKAEMEGDPNAAALHAAYLREHERQYETDQSRAALIAKLKAKHGLDTD